MTLSSPKGQHGNADWSPFGARRVHNDDATPPHGTRLTAAARGLDIISPQTSRCLASRSYVMLSHLWSKIFKQRIDAVELCLSVGCERSDGDA